MLTPLLSELDPKSSSEGSLDPLWLYPIADSLAEKLVPGVRERQIHPRFLTAMAVASMVCSDFEDDIIAKDEVSEPWQVFEWYLVEGLVRTIDDAKARQGVPGSEKATNALRDGVPLSAARYLKSPAVFGFHGVYRTLATNMDIIDDSGRLGDVGYRLIKIWESEQGLSGFCSNDRGSGAEIRRQLYTAVQKGLENGATAKGGGWGGWWFFKDHLAPLKFGNNEASFIRGALWDVRYDTRRQVMEFLCSKKGQKVWRDSGSEKDIHESLRPAASPELKLLLDAILAYEAFSRALQDAFDDCLLYMSQKKARVSLKELSKLTDIRSAQKNTYELFPIVLERLQPFGEATRFEDGFTELAEKTSTEEWIAALINHHIRIQQNKPPNGKNPWFISLDDGNYFIRSDYSTDKGGLKDNSYPHYYRTRPLQSFIEDMRLV